MRKRGVSLSFNAIIIAVIGLLVLALIVFLVGDNLGVFNKGTSCPAQGGRCLEDRDDCDTYTISGEDEELCERGVCCSLVPAG